VISHCYNMDGRAASQLITPRIPILRKKGILCSVISAPNGEHDSEPLSHHRVFSPSPSGLRFELRHFIRSRFRIPLLRGSILFLTSLVLLPFYLLEKVFVRLESQWSWFLTVYLRGLLLFRCNEKFDLVYSTGGPFSSHIAAILLSKTFGMPCICEIQDPLVFDSPSWTPRGRSVYLYKQIEKFICQNADAIIFLTQTAKEKAVARIKTNSTNFHSIYSGAPIPTKTLGEPKTRPVLRLEMAHFGSLAGSRNLNALFSGLLSVFEQNPQFKDIIKLSLYGNLDESVITSIEEFPYKEIVSVEGFVSHDSATKRMQDVDVLLLIQDDSYVARETIPSKVYEYLHSGKSVFALVHNEELFRMLKSFNCYSAEIIKPESIEDCLIQLLIDYESKRLTPPDGNFPNTSESVKNISKIAEAIEAKQG
jgi:hypothetical protein